MRFKKWMGMVAGGVLAFFLLLSFVLLIQVISLSTKQAIPAQMQDIHIESMPIAQRLAQALRIPTISKSTLSIQDKEIFARFRRFLETNFPLVHQKLNWKTINGDSLLYFWEGIAAEQEAVLLLAHQDVVPIEENTANDWPYPPFDGQIADGYIWGRGAMDHKSGVLGILEAVEYLLAEGFQPLRPVYIAFGHDEEVAGLNGAKSIANYLSAQGQVFSFTLDEGLLISDGIIPNIPSPVALIGIAEKGYVSVELSVKAPGGHSSMPPLQTTIGVLAAAIARLEAKQMPLRIESPVRQMFEWLAPEMPFIHRLLFANLWLFEPLVKRQLAGSTSTNAIIRTTTAPTLFVGGVRENVLPRLARAVINFRILPGDSVAKVLAHVHKQVDDARVSVQMVPSQFGEPSSISNIHNEGFSILNETIKQVFPSAIVAPSLVIPATDSRHFEPLSKAVYRFHPIVANELDLKRLHGVGERISVSGYANVVRFYVQLLRNLR